MEENKYVKTKSFKGALNRASKIIGDKERLGKVLQKTQEKVANMSGLKNEMNAFLEKVFTFIRMIRAYVAGTYREIPLRSILLILAGLIYFITPIDFLPDFIPGIGLIDDVSVILAIFNSMVEDVKKFQIFEEEREQDVIN